MMTPPLVKINQFDPRAVGTPCPRAAQTCHSKELDENSRTKHAIKIITVVPVILFRHDKKQFDTTCQHTDNHTGTHNQKH
eukprot:13318480-Alexandrium_andersonii.AAC.1